MYGMTDVMQELEREKAELQAERELLRFELTAIGDEPTVDALYRERQIWFDNEAKVERLKVALEKIEAMEYIEAGGREIARDALDSLKVIKDQP